MNLADMDWKLLENASLGHNSSKLIAYVFFFLTSISSAQTWSPLVKDDSLSGWIQRGGNATFLSKNGSIIGYSKSDTENSFLCTEQNYGDFILEFEFFIDDVLNSGVQLRSHSTVSYKNGRVYGNQFEIDPSERAWTGGIYDEARRGWLYPLTENIPAKNAFKNRQWNNARIEAIGARIRTWVNGILCSDLVDSTDSSGFIALQVHAIGNDRAKEGKTIRWRNIRICTQDVALYLLPEDPTVPHIIASAPKFNLFDFVSIKISVFILILLIIIATLFFIKKYRVIWRSK